MPLIVWSYLTAVAGLVGGFTFGVPGAAAATAVCAVALALSSDNSAAPTLIALACGIIAATMTPSRAGNTHSRPDAHGFRARQHASALRRVDAVFRDDAPIARALLLADQHEIPPAIKRRYADAGLIHMLSISGLHVTILAGAVTLALATLGLARSTVATATSGVTWAYVWLIGLPPPAVRAAAMLSVATLAHAAQRHTSRWAILAVGGLVPLVRPATVLDVGYQLSIAGMAALAATGALVRRQGRPPPRWARGTARALLTSAVATAVTAPLVAARFGRLSLVAPVTNLVADPLLALAQPMLFLALVIAPVSPLSHVVADAAHPLLAAFDWVAHAGARIPFGAVTVHPTRLATACGIAAAMASIVACAARFPARPAFVALAAIAIAVWVG